MDFCRISWSVTNDYCIDIFSLPLISADQTLFTPNLMPMTFFSIQQFQEIRIMAKYKLISL